MITEFNISLKQQDVLIERLALQETHRTIYWRQMDPFIHLRMSWRASMSRHLFHILPGQSILEIGAGDGEFAEALIRVTRNECPVTCVVFSEKHKNSLEKKFEGKNVKILFSKNFLGDLINHKFDYVISHHMLEERSRNTFLFLIKFLLKNGGGVLFFEPNPWNPYYRLRRFFQKVVPIKFQRSVEADVLNRIQIFYLLSEIGYTQINALPLDFLYTPVPKFLLWPVKHMGLILENFPIIRNLAGSLFIWAYRPRIEQSDRPNALLCDHQELFGKVSFVIPCHNEEMNVSPLAHAIIRHYDKYIKEIIFVDDNSQDETNKVIENLVRADARIVNIRRSPPNGVGLALREGLKRSTGEFVVIMDCDFQHLIPELRDLFDAIVQGADVAVGSRFTPQSVMVNYPFTKILANRAFHLLANIIFWKKHFRDISNNMKIYRRNVVDGLVIESSDFAANVETGLIPILSGFKVIEVPISWINRTVTMGLSTFFLARTGPSYFKLLFRLWYRYIKGEFKRKNVER